MSDCEHRTAVLPDPLPPALAAVLRIRRNDANGVDQLRIVDLVRRAVLLTHLTASQRKYKWTAAAACALVRLHPDVAPEAGSVADANVCAKASWALSVTILPGRTDLGLTERVALLHGHDLAWSADGQFRIWNGSRWVVDDGGTLVSEKIKHTVRRVVAFEAEYARGRLSDLLKGDPDGKAPDTKAAAAEAKAAQAFAAFSQSARAIRSAAELLRGEPGILQPIDVWDADDTLLGVANGTLALGPDGATLQPHRREDRLTHQTRAAYRTDSDRTDFENFISNALPDPDVRSYLQRVLGYGLLGHNAHRILLLLVGPTSSGKSTLLEVISDALGAYGASFKLTLFRSESEPGKARPDLVAALPRRVIVTTETSARWQLDADAVKRLTGNDSDAARTLHSGVYTERRPAFLPVVATNSAPKIRGADRALWRRLVAVPFDVSVPEGAEDTGLGKRLRANPDGVLAWLVGGYAAYARDSGFGPVPQACTDAARAVRADMTLVDRWLTDHTEAGPDYAERIADLADDWARWCVVHRIAPADQINAIALGGELSARGYGIGFGGAAKRRHRVRTGIRLRPDRETTHDAHPEDCDCRGCIGPIRQRWSTR